MQQDGFPWLQTTAFDEGVPGGDGRARQRRRFNIAQVGRRVYQALRIQHALFSEHTVERPAQGASGAFAIGGPGDPALGKDAHHAVTRLDAGCARAHCDHDARAIGAGN